MPAPAAPARGRARPARRGGLIAALADAWSGRSGGTLRTERVGLVRTGGHHGIHGRRQEDGRRRGREGQAGAADAKEKSGPTSTRPRRRPASGPTRPRRRPRELGEKAKPTTDKAKAEAAEIIEKAKKQGAELIEKAKTQGPELLEKAKKEAAELLEKAQKEANELLAKAKAQGRLSRVMQSDALAAGPDGRPRCFWAVGGAPEYVAYHDDEWGRPVLDGRRAVRAPHARGVPVRPLVAHDPAQAAGVPGGVRGLRHRRRRARSATPTASACSPTPASCATGSRSRRRSPTPAPPCR